MRTLLIALLGVLIILGVTPSPVEASERQRDVTIKRWNFNGERAGWTMRDTLDAEVAEKCVEQFSDHIELCLKKTNGEVREAMISTEASFAFTYGTVRARMTFRGPVGGHPGLWLIPPGDVYAQPLGHEIDVVEHFGADNRVQHNLWGYERDHFFQAGAAVDARSSHVYEVEWTPSRYVFRIDGVKTAEWVGTTSSTPHFLVLSYLSSDWERPNLDGANLWKYRANVDWVEVEY